MEVGGTKDRRTDDKEGQQKDIPFLSKSQAWCLHNPEICKLNPKQGNPKPPKGKAAAKLALTAALLLAYEAPESEDESAVGPCCSNILW